MVDMTVALKAVADALEAKQAELKFKDRADFLLTQLERTQNEECQEENSVVRVVEALGLFQAALRQGLNNPSLLFPGGDCCAGLAHTLGARAASKMTVVQREGAELLEHFEGIVGEVESLRRELADIIVRLPQICEEAEKLAVRLPKDLLKLAESVQDIADLAQIDLEPLRAAVDASSVVQLLDELKVLGQRATAAAQSIEVAGKRAVAFVAGLPGKVTGAFCLGPCFGSILKPAPTVRTMLKETGKLHEAIKVLSAGSKQLLDISEIDVESLRAPLAEFSASARKQLDHLDAELATARSAFTAVEGAVDLVQGVRAGLQSRLLRGLARRARRLDASREGGTGDAFP